MPDPKLEEIIARQNMARLLDPNYAKLLDVQTDFNFKPYMTGNSMVTGYHRYASNPLGQAVSPEAIGVYSPNAWQATKTYEHELGHSFSVPQWGEKTDWNFPAPRTGIFELNPQPNYNPMRQLQGLPPERDWFSFQLGQPNPMWEQFARSLFNVPQPKPGQPAQPIFNNQFGQANPMEAYAYWSENALQGKGGREQIPQNIQDYYPYLRPEPSAPLQGAPAPTAPGRQAPPPVSAAPIIPPTNKREEDPLAVIAPPPTITPLAQDKRTEQMQNKLNRFDL